MSVSDLWVQALLSANPSPVPSYASTSSHEDLDQHPLQSLLLLHQHHQHQQQQQKVDDLLKFDSGYAAQLAQMQLMWNPGFLQQFLALLQAPNIVQAKQRTPEPVKAAPEPRKRPMPTNADPKKPKVRRLEEDTVTSSPVSGMFIKEESAVPPVEELQKEADLLDETAAYVEVTEESRSRIEEIPNVIGDCICRLCKVKYEDVFKLAQHRCPRIAHEEYKCPECDKVFSCPANLASHRRWHKPRDSTAAVSPTTSSTICDLCGHLFNSKKQLKSHVAMAHSSPLQTLLGRVLVT